jgi:Protein of unknown function, DUF547
MSLMVLRKLMVGMLLILSGCASTIRPPGTVGGADPQAAWAAVLATFVDQEGRVAFDRLKVERQALDQYVAYIAATPPEVFPEGPQRLAYYLNSYNALAMFGVIERGIPSDLDGFLKRLRFFLLTKFVIGGKAISLYDYENDLIRKLGEPRVHFALNCMSIGCPRLPQAPFLGESLNAQLDAQAREFFNSSKYVQVVPERGVARLSEILDFFTDDFVNERVAGTLLEFVNRYRFEKIPEHYRVEFIPYDWTINRQA